MCTTRWRKEGTKKAGRLRETRRNKEKVTNKPEHNDVNTTTNNVYDPLEGNTWEGEERAQKKKERNDKYNTSIAYDPFERNKISLNFYYIFISFLFSVCRKPASTGHPARAGKYSTVRTVFVNYK